MINVVCVNVQNYLGRGQEYVRKLAAGVHRHLSGPYRFICVTDEIPEMLSPGVELAEPHPDPMDPLTTRLYRYTGIEYQWAETPPEWTSGWNPGWAQKVLLYRPGFLPPGPVLYIDLDTVILGDITPLTRIPVEFAGLRNFYDKGFGTGLLFWTEAGGGQMWEFFERAGPEARAVDSEQALINKYLPGEAPRIQDLVTGIYSYKVHCKAGPPPDARVVCFHGYPRTHECNGWVQKAWAE